MRLLIFLLLLTFSLTSCMDMTMNVEVDQKGAIRYHGDFDLSSMMPMLMMANEMEGDSTAAEDPIMELLTSGNKVDTVFSFFDMEKEIGENERITQEVKDKIRMRMVIDQDNGSYIMSMLSMFESIEEQEEILSLLDEASMEDLAGLGEDSEMMEGLFMSELDVENGILSFRIKVKDQMEDDVEGMNDYGSFAEAMVPKLKIRLTTPGKVKSVEGANYKMINDWKVLIELPMEVIDPSEEFVTVYFEPRSVFSKPEVTEVWEPKPERISFAGRYKVPSDAIVLLGEKAQEGWIHNNGKPAGWDFNDGVLTVKPGAGDIVTKENFGDCQLHVEWRTPIEEGQGQNKGNSGVFLQSRYEVQVLDSYENETYPNGQAASIYKQAIPTVNASLSPGEWQTYDILYKAPRWNKLGVKEEPARITVIHNGVLIHNNLEIKGTTEYIGLPKNSPHGDAPLKLQDHSHKVSYRNIWLRKL